MKTKSIIITIKNSTTQRWHSVLALLLLFLWIPLLLQAQKDILSPKSELSPVLPFCTENNELGPALVGDRLFFSAIPYEQRALKPEQQFFELFSLLNDSAASAHPIPTREVALNTEFHDGPLAYCAQTGELFLTRTDFKNAQTTRGMVKKTTVHLSIVVYKKQGDSWNFQYHFPFNHPDFSIGHPAIHPSGDTLVFVSTQNGGQGLSDLWQSVRSNGKWQEPVNLGKNINSPQQEMTPFFREDELLFASNRKGGLGGFDLYAAAIEDGFYQMPRLLPEPINSRKNDLSLHLHPNGLTGYLVSDRNNKNDNIYQLKIEDYQRDMQRLKEMEQQLAQVTIALNDSLIRLTEQEAEKEYLANNLVYTFNSHIVRNVLPDLHLSYHYQIIDNKLWPGRNVYHSCTYTIDKSHAVHWLLEQIKKHMQQNLGPFIQEGKEITFQINGNADTEELFADIPYEGEYGEHIATMCTLGNRQMPVTIHRGDTLNDLQLALLRAYGMKNFIENEIPAFANTTNHFQFTVVPTRELNINKNWITINIQIQNALPIFQ